MFKDRNFNLMFFIIIFIIIFLGIGTIILNKVLFNKDINMDDYRTDEDISIPYVSNIGLPDGNINLNNEEVLKLFSYFREDHNCMYNYVSNINGSNKTKLLIAYNYVVDKEGELNSCSLYNNLVINNKYFCSSSIDTNYTLYNYGINSNEFISYLKTCNTVTVDGGLIDQEMNNIFGNGVGYNREDFLYSNDSYIHYDGNINKYIMYKYFNNNGACKNYEEELVGATSNNGVLDIRSRLMDDGRVIKNIKRIFKYDQNTGNYIFQNRYEI